MRQKKQKRTAFTLIELLVVIMILSMIGVMVVPNVVKHIGRAKKDLAQPRINLVEDAVTRFYINCGRYPETLDELCNKPADVEDKWAGPYIKPKLLIDPWGNPFAYYPEGELNPGSFDIISYGADGQEGGEGENADITNAD